MHLALLATLLPDLRVAKQTAGRRAAASAAIECGKTRTMQACGWRWPVGRDSANCGTPRTRSRFQVGRELRLALELPVDRHHCWSTTLPCTVTSHLCSIPIDSRSASRFLYVSTAASGVQGRQKHGMMRCARTPRRAMRMPPVNDSNQYSLRTLKCM